jgi:hypothetical protein
MPSSKSASFILKCCAFTDLVLALKIQPYLFMQLGFSSEITISEVIAKITMVTVFLCFLF